MQKVENQEIFLGLREVLTVLFKHKRTIITVFFGVTILSLIIPFVITPIYEAQSSFLVKIGSEYMKNTVEPEIEILTSPDLSQRVLEALELKVVYPDLMELPPEGVSPMEVALIRFHERLSARQASSSNVVKVTFQHENPQIAARALNLLMDFWKEKHRAIFSIPQAPLLQEQAEIYRQKLEESQTQLLTFKQEQGISSFPEQMNLLLEQRQQLDATVKNIQNQTQGLKARIVSLTKQRKTIPKEIPLSTVQEQGGMIDKTKGDLLALQVKLGKYRETSRIVVDLRKEMDLMRAFIEEQESDHGRRVTSGKNPVHEKLEWGLLDAESEHAALQMQERVVAKQLQDLDDQISHLIQYKKELDRLDQEVIKNQGHLNRYLEKVEGERISEEMERTRITNVRVIQSATAPLSPIKPKKLVIVSVGVLLAGLFSLMLPFAREYLQTSYSRWEQVSSDLELPVLVSISQKG